MLIDTYSFQLTMEDLARRKRADNEMNIIFVILQILPCCTGSDCQHLLPQSIYRQLPLSLELHHVIDCRLCMVLLFIFISPNHHPVI